LSDQPDGYYSSSFSHLDQYLDWVLQTEGQGEGEGAGEGQPEGQGQGEGQDEGQGQGSGQANVSSVRLDVPLVEQFPLAPTGCEIASLTMLLLYAGYSTTLEQSLDEMWYSYDPDYGFVGDPRSDDGWTIYPECAGLWIAQRIGSYRNLTGVSIEDLGDVLRAGKPIVVWMVHPWVGLHCLCITGFDQYGFYLNDPYGLKDWFCAYDEFELYWDWYYRMALSY